MAVLCVVGSLSAASIGAGSAQAATAGIVPPHNPASDCDQANTSGSDWGIANINACRSLEGVGPLTLPSNWDALTVPEQGLVLIDLERVNRGIAPIVGLNSALNGLAATGAQTDDDPPFPQWGFTGGGGIWAGAASVFAADYLWMYDDGPNGFDANVDCQQAGAPGCWLHRDNILWQGDGGPLVAGGAFTGTPGDGSFAYLILSGYSRAGMTFTWAHELSYFAVRPTVEPLGGAVEAASTHAKPVASKHAKAVAPKHAKAVASKHAKAVAPKHRRRVAKSAKKRLRPRHRRTVRRSGS